MSTVHLTLPDGSQREMPEGSTARQLAESIGAGLARAALAATLGGLLGSTRSRATRKAIRRLL